MSESGPVIICSLDDLASGSGRGFTLQLADQTRDIFLVRQAHRVYAYLNRCPHTGAPLDWMPDRFLDVDGRYIQCAMHGALFRIEDGACLAGPCNGAGLQELPVEIRGGEVLLPAGFRFRDGY